MKLKAEDLRKMMAEKDPTEMVFLVPTNPDCGAAMIVKSVGDGDSPMVVARESFSNEQAFSWQNVCENYEIVKG